MLALFGSLLSFLLLYKYVALFLISFIASLAIPIPASSAIAAAGAFASQGFFNFAAVIIVAVLGNIVGDATGFLLVRWYGESVLRRIKLGFILRSAQYKNLKNYISAHPRPLIFFSRFLTAIGPLVNSLSGIARVKIVTFFTYDIIGNTLYVVLYAFLGYMLGIEWEDNIDFLIEVALTIFLFGVLVGVLQAAFLRRAARSKR